MAFRDRRTPGVYVTELSAFPPSVVGVQTAVPAFIGYTEKAEMSGKPVFLKPIRIGSLADYEQIFGWDYRPTYRITPATQSQIDGNTYDFKVMNPTVSPPVPEYYALTQTNDSKFNLYNSMRLFYANGGGNCYVVSVGNYEQAAVAAKTLNAEAEDGQQTHDGFAGANRDTFMLEPSSLKSTPVTKEALLNGLQAIREQSGPTMLVVPEAILLTSINDFADVAKAMLAQCAELQDRVALLDVYDTLKLNPGAAPKLTKTLNEVITNFRAAVGTESLNYGMAYFPFLDTTVVPATDFSYENVQPIDVPASPMSPDTLKTILTWENQNLYGDDADRRAAVQRYIDEMANPGETPPVSPPFDTPETINKNLTAALPLLADILRIIVDKNDILPPSPAMAGVYTYVDATRGVWNAPANISLTSVVKTTYKLDNDQQGDLNVPIDGKAVNAIREFVGRGNIVWGARTLDGNSNDYRYIQVRRTLVYMEQSIKSALNGFVFAANDGNTWVTVTSMVSNFLQDLWSRGGLMGAKASDAFDVQCGLGSTMTPTDVLQGYMIVQVRVQMIRPAEFIELTFKQKMEGIS